MTARGQPIDGHFERFVHRMARAAALGGGLLLGAVALMVCASIIGRQLDGWLFFAPIRGDYELVEAATAIAVFWFLPWCQCMHGHVAIDLLVRLWPPFIQALVNCLAAFTLALVASVMAWRLWLGLGDKLPAGPAWLRDAVGFGLPPFFPETTYELSLPLWWLYAAAWPGAALFAVTTYMTFGKTLQALLRRDQP